MRTMKYIYRTLVAFALIGSLTACSSDNVEPVSPTTGTDVLTLTVSDIEGKTDVKVGLPDEPTNNMYNFIWSGTAEDIWVYFTDGTTTASAKGTITIPTDWNTSTNPITITVTKPTAFQSIQSYQVSGAFGVDSMDASGNCTVTPKTTLTSEYEIPFYFNLTNVTKGTSKDVASISLHRYGSLMRVLLHGYSSASTTTFDTLTVQSGGAFSTSGKFNVNTSTYPTYTASDSYKVSDVHALSGFSATGTSDSAVVYVWFQADTTLSSSADSASRMVQVDATSKNDRANGYWSKYTYRTSALGNKKVYTMKPLFQEAELMITQLLYVNSGCAGYIEVYNPTDIEISLANYSFFDPTNSVSVSLGGPSSELYLVKRPATYTKSVTQSTNVTGQVLPMTIKPKQVLVYASYLTKNVYVNNELEYFNDSTNYAYYRDYKYNSGAYFMYGIETGGQHVYLRYLDTIIDDVRAGLVAEYNRCRKVTITSPNSTYTASEWWQTVIGSSTTSSKAWTSIYNRNLGVFQ